MMLAFFCLLGCKGENKFEDQQLGYKQEEMSYVLRIPAQVGMALNGYAVDLNRQEITLSFLAFPSRIERYSLTDGALIEKVSLGNQRIASVEFDGINYWALDAFENQLLHVDSQGHILNTFSIEPDLSMRDLGRIFKSAQVIPLTSFGNLLFFPASVYTYPEFDPAHSAYSTFGVVCVFDKASQQFTWLGQVHPLTQTMDFASSHRYSMALGDGQLIISPDFTKDLMRVDLSSLKSEWVEPSFTHLDSLLVPLKYWGAESDSIAQLSPQESFAAELQYISNSTYYPSIHFDPFSNLYYRILFTKKVKDNLGELYEGDENPNKIFVVQVYDAGLQYLGEVTLPNEYTAIGAFVSEKGLNLINRKLGKTFAHQLSYDAFTFEGW